MISHECGFLHIKMQNLSRQDVCMRDKILDLEVENFGYMQDLDLLETRLSKYQHNFRNQKECSELKKEIANLQAANEQQSNLNESLSEKLALLESNLEANIISLSDHEELRQTILTLQQAYDELQRELDQTREDLKQETCINEIDEDRTDVLSQLLQKKSQELLQTEEKCHCTEKKLLTALHENNELQDQILMLMNKTACFEQQSVLSDERTDYCQKEIQNCNNNLLLLNEKLNIMKDLLRQKDEQYSQLEAYYCVQTNAVECSKKICEESKAHYERDITDLKHTIEDLNEKLKKAEDNYHDLHHDYKKSQVLIVDASHRESKMQQDYVRCSQELTEKIQVSESEEARVREYARQVETQNTVLRNDIMTLQRQIELLKAQLHRLKSAAASQAKDAQEEMNNLKNELNKVIQQHSKLKAENDSLRLQISHIQAYEHQNRVTGEQLDQCLRELHTAQTEKQHLEAVHKRFVKDFKDLQEAYKGLDRDRQQLTQSVINVEHDLAVTKSSRDELCMESRIVINNVQSWVRYQKVINEQLKHKLMDNNHLINNLKREISYLESDSCNCDPKERQRGGTSQHRTLHLSSHSRKSNIGVSMQELPIPSSAFSNTTNEWCTYTESDDESVQEVDLSDLWVRKVENITQQLQISNEYWRSKMQENDYMVTRDQ